MKHDACYATIREDDFPLSAWVTAIFLFSKCIVSNFFISPCMGVLAVVSPPPVPTGPMVQKRLSLRRFYQSTVADAF